MTLRNDMKPPALSARKNLAVNRDGEETVYWPLYDEGTYPSTGISELNFFQNPIGQLGKTMEKTNMTGAGQLPANQSFIVTGVCVDISPSFFPSDIGGSPLAAYVNTLNLIANSGSARLFIGSKDYIQMAPIGSMPSKYRLSGFAAIADTSTAGNVNSQIVYAATAGEEHKITPLDIPSNQNFKFSMHWKNLVPTTFNASIRVYLNGWLTRNSQ